MHLHEQRDPESGQPPRLTSFLTYAAYMHHLEEVARHARSPQDPVIDAAAHMQLAVCSTYPEYADLEDGLRQLPWSEAARTADGFSALYNRYDRDCSRAINGWPQDVKTADKLIASMAYLRDNYQEHYAAMNEARREVTAFLDSSQPVPIR